MLESDVEKKILRLLSEELLSTSQIARKMNMRRDVAAGYLEALHNQGKLEKSRVGRSIIYRTISVAA